MASNSTSDVHWSNAISSTDHGAFVSIAAWLMMLAGMMFLLIRIMIRVPLKILFGSDDYLAAIATFLAMVHTIAILLAVKFGLGKHVADLVDSEGGYALHRMSIAIYIGEIFLVLGITCAKLSVSLLFVRLASGRRHVRPAWVLSGIILLWGIASVIGVGVSSPFRHKGLPEQHEPWPKSWIAFSALNILLEIALFIYPLYLIWDLQMSLKSKATVVIGFALRLPTSVVACMRLISLIQASRSVTDISWTYVRTAVLTEVEMHYSLIAATIPCMHLFLRHFSTGYLSTTADQYCPEGSRAGTNDDSYGMYSSSASASAGKPNRNRQSHDHAADFDFGDDFPSPQTDEQNPPPALHINTHSPNICPKQQAKTMSNEGWVERASGCAGSTTTKIAHSQHASDGSVTSDGSDKIIVKKTVDVHYGK